VWFATPSPSGTFIHYSLPVFPAHPPYIDKLLYFCVFPLSIMLDNYNDTDKLMNIRLSVERNYEGVGQKIFFGQNF
jgi:hypothetical protein